MTTKSTTDNSLPTSEQDEPTTEKRTEGLDEIEKDFISMSYGGAKMGADVSTETAPDDVSVSNQEYIITTLKTLQASFDETKQTLSSMRGNMASKEDLDSMKENLREDLRKDLKEEFNSNFSRLERELQRLDNVQRNLSAFSPLFNSDNRKWNRGAGELTYSGDALVEYEEDMVPVPKYY